MLMLAMDRASVRRFDIDGHMHVESANFTKANVCPYFGREIPNWQQLGLDGNRVYNLFRDPTEIEKGAATLAGKPLLDKHLPVTSRSHPTGQVAGAVGTNIAFDGTYLTGPMSVWVQSSINRVKDNTQRELSCGYRYRADMTPGHFNGIAYDGVMRDIVFNHVALVKQGRAGPDCVVGDEDMLSNRVAAVKIGLLGHVAPLLAQDTDIKSAFEGITSANVAECKDAIVAAVIEAVTPNLAEDTAIDAETLGGVIDRSLQLAQDENDEAPAPKPAPKKVPAKVKVEGSDDPVVAGLDAATVQKMIDDAVSSAVATAKSETQAETTTAINAAHAARAAVKPLVGEVHGMDSAEAIYAFALDKVGVKPEAGTPIGTLKIMVEREVASKAPAPRIASDAAPANSDFSKRFPNAVKLVRS